MRKTNMRAGGYQGPGSVLTAGLARFGDSLGAERFAIERVDDVTRDGADRAGAV